MTVSLPDELEAYLRDQAGRLGVPVETLVSRTIEERWGTAAAARGTEAPLAPRETELLLAIQNAFPPEETVEYRALVRRRDDGDALADAERARLLDLIERRDLQNAARLEALAELARLRGVSLREVMAQLGIRPE